MKVKIKRLDRDLPLPRYETLGSVGFDFLCRESVAIKPHSLELIPANVVVETPPGYMLMVTLRSSTPRKRGLLIPHGVGVIDQDYCGEGDEIKIQVYNFTSNLVTVERGIGLPKAFSSEWIRRSGRRSIESSRRHAAGLGAPVPKETEREAAFGRA